MNHNTCFWCKKEVISRSIYKQHIRTCFAHKVLTSLNTKGICDQTKKHSKIIWKGMRLNVFFLLFNMDCK